MKSLSVNRANMHGFYMLNITPGLWQKWKKPEINGGTHCIVGWKLSLQRHQSHPWIHRFSAILPKNPSKISFHRRRHTESEMYMEMLGPRIAKSLKKKWELSLYLLWRLITSHGHQGSGHVWRDRSRVGRSWREDQDIPERHVQWAWAGGGSSAGEKDGLLSRWCHSNGTSTDRNDEPWPKPHPHTRLKVQHRFVHKT